MAARLVRSLGTHWGTALEAHFKNMNENKSFYGASLAPGIERGGGNTGGRVEPILPSKRQPLGKGGSEGEKHWILRRPTTFAQLAKASHRQLKPVTLDHSVGFPHLSPANVVQDISFDSRWIIIIIRTRLEMVLQLAPIAYTFARKEKMLPWSRWKLLLWL